MLAQRLSWSGAQLLRHYARMSPQHAMSTNGTANQAKRIVRGVVFDMDGTLTVPCIDFVEMRRRVGITEGDILHVIDSWGAEARAKAYAAIAEVEEEALKKMQTMPGAVELCAELDAAGVPRALVTRNVSSSVDFFHKTAFNLPPFWPALSREWTPYKPDPAALLHIAEHWGTDSRELVMVGDSAKDDIVCGNRAGALTILLDINNAYSRDDLQGEKQPHFVCKSLSEVAEVLKNEVELLPPAFPQASAAGAEESS